MGVVVGVLDGLLGTIKFVYDAAATSVSWLHDTVLYLGKTLVTYLKGGVAGVSSQLYNDLKPYFDSAVVVYNKIVEFAQNINLEAVKIQVYAIWNKIFVAIKDWVGDFLDGCPKQGYDIGLIVFEIIVAVFSGGSSAAAKIGAKAGGKAIKKIIQFLDKLHQPGSNKIASMFDEMVTGLNSTARNAAARLKALKCKILLSGCFVKDTPILVASSSSKYYLKQLALGGLIAASAPVAAIPIQEVQLLDYVVAHQSVNLEEVYRSEAIAGTEEFWNTASSSNQEIDLYTSPQQRQRDTYSIDSLNWYAVTFTENYGSSTAQFALHRDWIEQKGYEANKVVDLNLPEQGIVGPFTITSIKHILPQKKPTDEDESDDYAYQPVTGLISHASNSVYDVTFTDTSTLGVTYQHPIYSVTAGDWRFAGALQPGEEVLTHAGKVAVATVTPRNGVETVYNLEVKEWHNFLVGDAGVVVHNACTANQVRDYLNNNLDNIPGTGTPSVESVLASLRNLKGLNQRKFDQYLTEFNDKVPLHFGDSHVKIWQQLEIVRPSNGIKGWEHRADLDFLKRVHSKQLSDDALDKLGDFYYTFTSPRGMKCRVNFAVEKRIDIGDGIQRLYRCEYDNFGFPKFENFTPRIIGNDGISQPVFYRAPNLNQRLNNGPADFIRANEHATSLFPNGVVA